MAGTGCKCISDVTSQPVLLVVGEERPDVSCVTVCTQQPSADCRGNVCTRSASSPSFRPPFPPPPPSRLRKTTPRKSNEGEEKRHPIILCSCVQTDETDEMQMDRALKNPAVDSAVQLTQTLFTVIRRIIILCTLMYERLRSLRVFTKCTSVTSFQFLSQIGLFNSLKDILLKKNSFHNFPQITFQRNCVRRQDTETACRVVNCFIWVAPPIPVLL